MADSTAKHTRENLVKMLLTTSPVNTMTPNVNSEVPSPTGETQILMNENPNKIITYLHQLAGNYEVEVDVIMKDHCYARPSNWKPENIYVKPVKRLFFSKIQNTVSKDILNPEEFINIDESDPEPQAPPYDLSKARQSMDEFQSVANFVRPESADDDWEEKIDKILWSPVQNRIFSRVVRILNSERISRLSNSNSKHEPIIRRTSIDNTAKRFRETMSSAHWDWRITQWLHCLLFDYLPQNYLAIYLDILQTLRQKIPQLIDKMVAAQPNINSKSNSLTWETLAPLLKKSWDPVAPVLNANRPDKLPGNPILLVVPSGISTNVSSRQQKWITQLGALGVTVTVNPHLGLTNNRMTMIAGIEQLVQITRAKIQDVRVDYPGRPIILVGFNTGAALACQISQMEHVTSIVCLGFPMNTVDGKRGNPDDCLLDVRCPVMFIIGQNSILARVDDVEDLREHMLVPTSLVVVGSADDHLRISTSKKINERISQSMVDRCILDEIGDFVAGILSQSHPLPLRSPNSLNNYDSRQRRNIGDGRKRKNSTSSSVDSEPPSPNLKKIRPHSPHLVNANNAQRMSVNSNALPRGTLVTLTGTTATQTPKRKSRGFVNQNFSEHLVTSRLTPQQQNIDSSTGGITLNIGSFASLAPVGPIRFEPTSISVQSTSASKSGINTIKTSNAFIKVSKNNQVNIGGQQQSVAKIKMIMPTKKQVQRTSHLYKNFNPTEKSAEINMVNVLSPTSSGIRVSLPTSTVTNMKATTGTATTVIPSFHTTKPTTVTTLVGKSTATSSSIVLTPKNSVPVTTTTKVAVAVTTTSTTMLSTMTTKVADISVAGDIKKQPMIRASQLNQLMKNPTVILGTPVKARSSKSGVAPKISLRNVQNLASQQIKPLIPDNSMKINLEASEPSQLTSSSLDDDLGNILDIPIIIAKDGENLNNFERLSPLPQTVTPVTLQSSTMKSLPVINAMGNKVVFINKSLTSSTDAGSSQNTMTLSRSGLSTQPTIKYTKIILTKKPEHEESQKNNSVILTKTKRANNYVVLDPKSSNRIPSNCLGELQNSGKKMDITSSSQNSNILRAKQTHIGPNVENGEKS